MLYFVISSPKNLRNYQRKTPRLVVVFSKNLLTYGMCIKNLFIVTIMCLRQLFQEQKAEIKKLNDLYQSSQVELNDYKVKLEKMTQVCSLFKFFT